MTEYSKRKETVKRRNRFKNALYSKYDKCKFNPYQLNCYFNLNEMDIQKLVLGVKYHFPPHLKDFLIDNALIVVDKLIEEHPEYMKELFEHPERYHPKPGHENIFKPKKIIFDIDIKEEIKKDINNGT